MGDTPSIADDPDTRGDMRARIVEAAADLIARGGRDAATTRAVSAAAGVQPPTIYRLFGDKRGLLDAVAQHGIATYVAEKAAREPHPDPVEDLREGWDTYASFGLAHPDLFMIMSCDPQAHLTSPATAAGEEVLRTRVRRIAQAGRLKVSEARAVALIQAAGAGTVLTLLRQPEATRDLEQSAFAREAVLAAITDEAVTLDDLQPRRSAAALSASLDQTAVLTDGERHLLAELLERIADGGT